MPGGCLVVCRLWLATFAAVHDGHDVHSAKLGSERQFIRQDPKAALLPYHLPLSSQFGFRPVAMICE
jgi:hypothetical protein